MYLTSAFHAMVVKRLRNVFDKLNWNDTCNLLGSLGSTHDYS